MVVFPLLSSPKIKIRASFVPNNEVMRPLNIAPMLLGGCGDGGIVSVGEVDDDDDDVFLMMWVLLLLW